MTKAIKGLANSRHGGKRQFRIATTRIVDCPCDGADDIAYCRPQNLAPPAALCGVSPFHCMSAPNIASQRILSSALAPVGMFVLAHAAIAAIFMYLVRQNLDGGESSVTVAILHVGALVGCVLGGVRLVEVHNRSKEHHALATGALVAYLLPLLGYAFGSAAVAVPGLLSVFGLYLSVKVTLRSGGLLFTWACIGGVLSGIWASISLNAEIYAHVLSYEFTLLGWQAADPVFHSAIAALFQNYGMVTNGIDGTSFLSYHVFSHIIAAGSAFEAGEKLPLVYPALNQIFIIPGLLFGTSAAVVSLSDRCPRHCLAVPFLVILFWMTYEWLGAYNSFLVSESYAYSLGLLSFGLVFVASGPQSQSVTSWLVLSALLAVVSVAAKFTLALAWALLLAYGVGISLRTRPRFIKLVIFGAALIGYAGLVLLLLHRVDVQNTFEWFGYARHLRRNFYASLIVLCVGALSTAVGRRMGLPTPSWHVLVALFIALHLPDSFVYVGSGEYYWFHPADQIASIVAIAAITTFLACVLQTVRAPSWFSAPVVLAAIGGILLTGYSFPRSVSTLATTFLAFEKLANAGEIPADPSFPNGARSHEMARSVVVALGGEPFNSGLGSVPGAMLMLGRTLASGVPAQIGLYVANEPLAKVVDSIASEKALYPGKELALFIGPANAWYWESQSDCFARPFAIQSLTGLALVAGLPPRVARCPDSSFYGLGVGEAARSRDLDRSSICKLALKSKLRRLIVVSAPTTATTVVCQ